MTRKNEHAKGDKSSEAKGIREREGGQTIKLHGLTEESRVPKVACPLSKSNHSFLAGHFFLPLRSPRLSEVSIDKKSSGESFLGGSLSSADKLAARPFA